MPRQIDPLEDALIKFAKIHQGYGRAVALRELDRVRQFRPMAEQVTQLLRQEFEKKVSEAYARGFDDGRGERPSAVG